MKHVLPFLIALLLTAGCQSSNKERKSSFPEIRVNQTPDEKEITLQEIAEEISYIPLETNDSMLLRGVFLSICNEGIAVMHQADGRVFLYDGKGKAKGSICRKGGGPKEYVGMQQAVVDWKRNELFVLDYKPRIRVYDLNGRYKRTLPMNEKVRDREMYPFGKRYLAFFKEVPNEEIGKLSSDFAPYAPILLMDKESGETLSLPHIKSSNASVRLPSGWVNNYSLYTSGKQLYLSDISSDTIYRIHTPKQQPEAIIARTPPVKSLEGSDFFVNLEGATDRYYFFLRTNKEMKIDQRGDTGQYMQNWMYDLQTGETCIPIFRNDDYASLKLDAHALIHCHSEENCLYVKLKAFDLIEALENDELSGELKSIAEELQEDDNPVLMVVKL